MTGDFSNAIFRQLPLAEFFRHPLPLIGHESGKSTRGLLGSEVCKIDQSLKSLIGIVFLEAENAAV
jgi:hypothetical protein